MNEQEPSHWECANCNDVWRSPDGHVIGLCMTCKERNLIRLAVVSLPETPETKEQK